MRSRNGEAHRRGRAPATILLTGLLASAAIAALAAGRLAAGLTSPSSGALGRVNLNAAGAPAHPQGLAASETVRGGTSAGSVFDNAVTLPGSSGYSEPSVANDARGNVFVVAPGGIGGTGATAPIWESSDGGRSFTAPTPTDNNAAGQGTPLGGGDSDIAVDSQDSLYVADLWVGNSDLSVSSDGGRTWTTNPAAHPTPVDDRPWLTYDPRGDALYMVWDGGDGVHVGRALLRGTGVTAASVVLAQDVIAVPEVATTTGNQAVDGVSADGQGVRECVCPTGNIAIDPNGDVFFPFNSQNGIAVAESSDHGVTWTLTDVPGTEPAANFVGQGTFPVLRSDSAGNLYMVWVAPVSGLSSGGGSIIGNAPCQTGVVCEVFYSWLSAGATQWSPPLEVSSSAVGSLFPTLAVVRPGVVDIGYIDGSAVGGTDVWSIVLAQATDALSTPMTRYTTADADVFAGPLPLPRGGAFGDFFSMLTDADGMAEIAVDARVGAGFSLVYLRQNAPVPDAPSQPTVYSNPTLRWLGLPSAPGGGAASGTQPVRSEPARTGSAGGEAHDASTLRPNSLVGAEASRLPIAPRSGSGTIALTVFAAVVAGVLALAAALRTRQG